MTQTLETGERPGKTRQAGRGARAVALGGRGVATLGRSALRAVSWPGQLRYAKTWRRLLKRAVAVTVLAGTVYLVVTFLQVWWMSNRDGAREADVALVMGAAQYDGRPSAVLEERLQHALELYETDLVDGIVVTGGKQEGDRFTEADASARYLRARGVPDEDLILEVQGTNSWESLAASARILRSRELTDVLLVTDGYHALRVRAIAEELGLRASVSPSHRGGSVRQLVQESGAVAVGRVVGFRRLVQIDDRFGPRSHAATA